MNKKKAFLPSVGPLFLSILLGACHIFAVCFPQTASALVFQRRLVPKSGSNYFIFPVYMTIPGTGSAYGLGFYSTGLLGEETTIMSGKVQGDFEGEALWLQNVPTGIQNLYVSPLGMRVRNLSVDQYAPGSGSSATPNMHYSTSEATSTGVEFSYQLFDNQLELYLNAIQTRSATETYTSYDGADYGRYIDEDVVNWLYRFGLYIDDTDNRRDPHIGYRIKWERWRYGFSDASFANSYQDDLDVGFFYPFVPDRVIWVADVFYSQSRVTRKPAINVPPCTNNDPPECEQRRQEEIALYEEEASTGQATALGGTQRMRSYPAFRFQDAYTFFVGNEIRYYALENWLPFDFLFARGIYNSLQFAAFYELGNVASSRGVALLQHFKASHGLGIRAVFGKAVLRLDYAWGDEGGVPTVFWGYPF